MKFKTYDIVKIKKAFTLNIEDKEISFPSNIEGVIVEDYDDEFLIEFIDGDNNTNYALIEKDDLTKVWSDNNER